MFSPRTSDEEVQNTEENESNNIEDFSYNIYENEIFITDYNGNSEILEIEASYIIDGKEYNTNLTEFQVGIGNSTVKTLILDEGITEIKTSIFNSCDIEKVYFPKSIEFVYDYTLSYLHPDDGETIKIYYGGTSEEWAEIFTEYERTKVSDAETAGEKGEAAADYFNELLGANYDSSLFEYYFSASPDDLR